MNKKKLLFNPLGDDSLNSRKIIGGNPTNILNLNNVKFKWANKLYRIFLENFWIPEKIDLSTDTNDYNKLTPEERKAYEGILSFLVFLDSIQTYNVPNLNEFITASEVNSLLVIQAFQEVVHAQSYQYIIESIIPKNKRNKIYDLWKEDNVLFKRNELIANTFQAFIDDNTEENFFKAMVADYILEGLYFYNGFNFFYNLASRNLMSGSSDVIRYINRDELTHVVLFANIIQEIINKHIKKDISNYKEEIYSMFDLAVSEEIKWTNHIIGDGVLGINLDSTDRYTKWLANKLLKDIGLGPLYKDEKYDKNPYAHLEKIADTKGEGDVKVGFFEATVTSYMQSSSVDGWDDF